ncbi:MAG: glycosyl transferase family 28 [Ferruginibacter sp.]
MIAPLDWGLGHSTRCIPIIKELLEQGCEVLIAAEGAPKSVLQNEFPQLIFLSIKNYNIQYSHKTKLFSVALLLQTPQILFAIYKEHQWLKKIVKEQNIDALISDNRFGLYHSIVPSVYITHQLLIKTNNCFTEKIAQRIHYWFIKKHTQCWVPDFEKEPAIAGELSHPKKLPASVNYIGCLSRFEKKPGIEKKYDLLIILSGPEPQRTIFENILLQQLKEYNGIVLLVRGLPTNSLNNINSGNIKIVNHLKSSELNIAIQQSEIVISRSGYTTIMDLIKLQKKSRACSNSRTNRTRIFGKISCQ